MYSGVGFNRNNTVFHCKISFPLYNPPILKPPTQHDDGIGNKPNLKKKLQSIFDGSWHQFKYFDCGVSSDHSSHLCRSLPTMGMGGSLCTNDMENYTAMDPSESLFLCHVIYGHCISGA